MEIIRVGYGEAFALGVSQGEYVKAGYSGEYEQLRADLAAAKAEVEANKSALGRKCYENATLQVDLGTLKERERTNDILLEQQGDKLAALNDELAAAKAEIEKWKLMYQHESVVSFKRWEHLDEQLAARDLVIKQMTDALSECRGWLDCDDPFEKETALTADKALALQPTTEALDAYVQEQLRSIISQNVIDVQRAKEEVRDKCAAKCDEIADSLYDNGMKDGACAAWKCEAEIREMEL